MKLGVMIEGQEGVTWTQWERVVQWTEELGLESIWLSDHLMPLAGRGRPQSIETFMALSYVATHTRRIRFGSLVTPMTFRHPIIVARMAGSLDQLSGGRFTLGIGAGWNEREHRTFGLAFVPTRQRSRMLDEGAAVIRLLGSGAPASFRGNIFALSNAVIRPRFAGPLLIGGAGERRTLATVARYADEWNTPGISITRYRQKVASLAAHCAAINRDPATVSRSLVFTHATATTERKARHLADSMIADTPQRFHPGVGPDSPAWLVGAPDRIIAQLRDLQAEGVERVMLQWRRPPERSQLELISREIAPYV
jgi:alkanesulfonate monooxygenase SsuD/methylene tetrahydromethanopterin reductase-like flavin-dependent oxidoreductase (luciferase family)